MAERVADLSHELVDAYTRFLGVNGAVVSVGGRYESDPSRSRTL